MACGDEPPDGVTGVTHRAWRVTLTDGSRLFAVRPEGATRVQMFGHVSDTFGDRVREIEPCM